MAEEDSTAKYCGGCKRTLPQTEFHKNKTKIDGSATQCKECVSAHGRRWRSEHKELCRDRAGQYRLKNREYDLAKKKLYYIENRERMLSTMRDRYRTVPEVRERIYAWQADNYQKARRYKAATQARRRSAFGTITGADIEKKLIAQNHQCAACHTSLHEVYHVDHIKALSRGGLNTSDNIQLLCPRCNMRKGTRDNEEFLRELQADLQTN